MWIKLFNKFINLDNIEMVELYEGKDGRRIEIYFVSDSVITLWEDAEGKNDFDKVWKIFYENSLNSVVVVSK